MKHIYRHYLLLSVTIHLLLSLSLEPALARCSLSRLTSGTPVALVIANSQYQQTLGQSVNDANVIKTVLKTLGFRVLFKTELNKADMNRTTVEFADCLKTTQGLGLLYFSGYGMQLDRKNYLLPINITILDKFDIDGTFSVDKMLARFKEINNPLNIIFLDASRENPYPKFDQKIGLATMSPPSGFFISYAAEPNQIVPSSRNKNGLYAQKIVEYLKRATQNHTRIEDVFMQITNAVEQHSNGLQIPWYNGSSKERFCFGGCRNQTSRPTSTPSRPTRKTAKLMVFSNIDGAFVYINGQFAGAIQDGRIEKQSPLGRITVRVEKKDCDSFKQSFQLRTDKRINAQLNCTRSQPLCSCCSWQGCFSCPCR